jgi:pullulanase
MPTPVSRIEQRPAEAALFASPHRAASRPSHPHRTLQRPALATLALLFGVAGSSVAGAEPVDPALLADCNAAAISRVLQPAARDGHPPATALWLDAQRLRWAEAGANTAVHLYHAAGHTLQARAGSTVSGEDGRLVLTTAPAPLAEDAARRHAWFGPGRELQLPPGAATRLPELLRGQLLLVEEDGAGRVLRSARIQHAPLLDALYAEAAADAALGARAYREHARLALWAPTARAVHACLYADGRAPAEQVVALQRQSRSGIWQGKFTAQPGGYYLYLVDVLVPGVGLVRNRVTDPYSLALNTQSRRSQLVDLDDPTTQPAGWAASTRPPALAAPTDQVIYELHVRDFSLLDDTVPAADRGKYLGFAHADSRGMRHLRALAAAGLTDIHLLPVFDFATVPESGCATPSISGTPDGETQQAAIDRVRAGDCFNWGYDPLHFTAPEGSYASEAEDGRVRVREFRAMVMALHAAGLRVGMDVVYNHTSASGQHEHSVLDRIVPGYFQRLNRRGEVETSTCCANTATENAMMAKLMIDSAAVWARDYRIDSFRFDLMGHQPRAAMEALQAAVDAAAGRRIDLLGEGWNFGEVADGSRFVQASQRSLQDSGIATFSDRARDALRGGGCCDSGEASVREQGYLNGQLYAPNASAALRFSRADLLRSADLVRAGLAGTLAGFELVTADGSRKRLDQLDYAGQPAGYVAQPGEVVNYVENHDNQTLFDINVLKLPQDTPPAERARVQLLGAAFVAFSQGIAYYHAGIDLLRSKSLDRNSYDSGDWFNRLDWSYRDNFYASGLPPAWDNRASWPQMRPRLADARIKPGPEHIDWTRRGFLDLLRIRSSTPLFRLREAEDVRRRLRFHNTGPQQLATVIVGELDGSGLADAGFAGVLYALNVGLQAETLTLPEAARHGWRLHPVHQAADAADRRAADEARYDAASGALTVPARTAVVFVR